MKSDQGRLIRSLCCSFLFICSCTANTGIIKQSYDRRDVRLDNAVSDDWYELNSVFSPKLVSQLRQNHPLAGISEVSNIYHGKIDILWVKAKCIPPFCPFYTIFLGEKKLIAITDWTNRNNYARAIKKLRKELTVAEMDTMNTIIEKTISYNEQLQNINLRWP